MQLQVLGRSDFENNTVRKIASPLIHFCTDDEDEQVPWLISEYMAHGDLCNYVRDFRGRIKYVS
jgi:hypothetical protein